jgi:transcription elongation factor GreA
MKRPMTPRGYAALRNELMKLKSMRPELARAIEIARGHGDLSENGDYDAAKEKSGMVEAKIRDIEARLSNAEVIDPRKLGTPTRVVFGVSVKLEDIDSGEQRVISLVGAEESDVEKGWISFEAPLGKGVIGKELGDVARVALPGGAREFEILEIFVDYQEEASEPRAE